MLVKLPSANLVRGYLTGETAVWQTQDTASRMDVVHPGVRIGATNTEAFERRTLCIECEFVVLIVLDECPFF